MGKQEGLHNRRQGVQPGNGRAAQGVISQPGNSRQPLPNREETQLNRLREQGQQCTNKNTNARISRATGL